MIRQGNGDVASIGVEMGSGSQLLYHFLLDLSPVQKLEPKEHLNHLLPTIESAQSPQRDDYDSASVQ
jgi:hypothetical protein